MGGGMKGGRVDDESDGGMVGKGDLVMGRWMGKGEGI